MKDNAFCHHLRALDVFVETVRWFHENSTCNYYAKPWNTSYTPMETLYVENSISECDPENCPLMGIGAENFNGYSLDKDNKFYVSTLNRKETCLKYFADHREGKWSDVYPRRSFTRQMAIYFMDLTALVTDNIILQIPHYIKNLRDTIWKKIRGFTSILI